MRKEKQFLLDEIKDKIEDAKGFIVTRYQGLTANKAREFRDVLAKAEGEFEIVRKKVFLKALEKAGLETSFVGEMEGHVGVVFAKQDVAAVTKAAVNYGKDNDEAIKVLGGKIENELYGAQDMIAISSLPSLPEMRAAFLGVLQAPLGNIVSIFNAHMSGLLNCLEEKAKKEQ